MLTDWKHLQKYGYAPGGYMSKCSKCETVQFDMDKRATTCLRCATSMHEAEVRAEAQEPIPCGARGITMQVDAERVSAQFQGQCTQQPAQCPKCEESRQTINWHSHERGKLQAKVAELEQAYKDKDEAATQLVTAMRDMAGKVAEQSGLIEKCETALLIERNLYREDNPDGEPDHIYEALAAIAAHKKAAE